jgi:hypothetical protein
MNFQGILCFLDNSNKVKKREEKGRKGKKREEKGRKGNKR